MTRLSAADFPAFFEAVWGKRPFPWQARLADKVCAGGGWPALLDLPTAAGKTAALAVAVFHLALEAKAGPARRAPLRIVFVVDRRLVVDDAWGAAVGMARRLQDATDGILCIVANRLRDLAGEGEPPLTVARLRGGMPREAEWARTPCQPLIVCSTVDQVGSRLLFRGYGISDSMKPVHAGLLGADALWLLDEAHMSAPLVQTLGWIDRYRRPPWTERPALAPFGVVSLSATPVAVSNETAFGLCVDDRAPDALGPRLAAHKKASLVRLPHSLRDGFDHVAAAYADRAVALSVLGDPPESAKVLAIVVNRVRLARAIHDRLAKRFAADVPAGADVELLIGRARPLDRDRQLQDLLPRMRARDRVDGGPLFVVATQTVEVGADLDFDALVTEVAPLDSLRQRFGRLDREGRLGDSAAAILAASDEIGGRVDDPIYGNAAAATWDWLLGIATVPARAKGAKGRGRAAADPVVDFGVDWLPRPDNPAPLLPLRADAPLLLPAYVDLWAQTSPVPAVDPDVAAFLHGVGSTPPEVTLLWRADIPRPSDKAEDIATAALGALPPSSLESVSLPIATVARWMLRAGDLDPPDLEGVPVRDLGPVPQRRVDPVWRWDGDSCTAVGSPAELRPGQVLIAPAHDGGCDRFGWAPDDAAPVPDLAEEAALRHRHRLVLRITRERLAAEPPERDTSISWDQVLRVLVDRVEGRARDLVADLLALDGLPPRWRWALEAMGRPEAMPRALAPYGSMPEAGCILILDLHRGDPLLADLGLADLAEPAGEAVTETDGSPFALQSIPLADHSAGVQAFARRFAQAAGLPDDLVDAVAWSGWLHDLGKAEPRFQAMMQGGHRWAVPDAPLAKSDHRMSPRAREQARQRSGLPRHARHECWSVRLAESWPGLLATCDPDLVLWLVGTHHGWGRPCFPPMADPDAQGAFSVDIAPARLTVPTDHGLTRVDAGWPDRFRRLLRRYGAWDLARLEAILRLADHRRSEAEQPSRGP